MKFSSMHRLDLLQGNFEKAWRQDVYTSQYSLKPFKDDKPEQIKHELIQYSVRTINNSQVSRKTYPRKMHALYEKTSLYESDSAIFCAD